MTDINTLAPCPFCGGDARRSTGGHGSNAWFGTGCGANPSCPAHLRALMHRTQFDADVAWNRRAPAPASQPVAVPAGIEPFGIWHVGDTEAESDFFLFADSGDASCEACIKLYTAAQVQAMLSAGLAPGWQAVPVEPAREMERAIAAQFCGTADEVRRAWAEGIAAAPSVPVREPLRCACHACWPIAATDPGSMFMRLCPSCGNKRCPKANDHRHDCTGSNEPGQPGSAYPAHGITAAQNGADHDD